MRYSRRRIGGVLTAAALFLVLAMVVGRGAGEAPALVTTIFHGEAYLVRAIDPARENLRLYWDDGHGNPLGNFAALEKQVGAEGGRLVFAANAGMFEPTGKPVGLLVENGEEKFPLNLDNGAGNFYLKPNGVFVINGRHHAFILESENYSTLATPALWATQSGPLLVHLGDIHPDFMPASKNRKIRSGIGVNKKGVVIFALSKQSVALYEFAGLFRDRLDCPNALYLDGDISAFWIPGMPESKQVHSFGPLFGIVQPVAGEGVTAAAKNP